MNPTAQQLKDLGYVETAPGHFHKGGELVVASPRILGGLHANPVGSNPTPPPKPPKRIRQSSKPVMNALELAFYSHLCAFFPSCSFHAQSVRFKLGNGIWYKPDVVCFDWDCGDKARIACWEVKGPFAHRGGFENLKVAAHHYPEITWTLVWKENDRWQEQHVRP